MQAETRIKGRGEENRQEVWDSPEKSPKHTVLKGKNPITWFQSEHKVLGKRRPSPVVRCVGLVYLHQAVILVGRMVRSQDVHLIPLLRFLPVNQSSENERRGI